MFHRMLERVRNDGRDSFVQFASLKGPDGRGKGEVALRRVYNDAATLGTPRRRLIFHRVQISKFIAYFSIIMVIRSC